MVIAPQEVDHIAIHKLEIDTKHGVSQYVYGLVITYRGEEEVTLVAGEPDFNEVNKVKNLIVEHTGIPEKAGHRTMEYLYNRQR